MGLETSCPRLWPGWLQYLLISCPASMPAPFLIFFSQQKVESSCCCFCSVSQLHLTLCDPMDCSTPGLSVPHHLPKLSQVHVHWTGNAIHPSYSLTPSSSALNLSEHQGLFQWASCYHQVTKIFEFQLLASVLSRSVQGWFSLRLTDLISLLSKGLSGVFSSSTVWRHQFFGIFPSLWSSSQNRTWPLGRHSLDYTDLCRQSNISAFQHSHFI